MAGRWRVIAGFCACLGAAAPGGMPGASHAQQTAQMMPVQSVGEQLIVTVTVNGREVDDAALVIRQQGRFFVGQEVLAAGQVTLTPSMRVISGPGGNYVDLASLPGLSVRFDDRNQVLALTAGTGAVAAQVLDLSPEPLAGSPRARMTSGFLNYDIVAQTASGGQNYAAGFLDAGVSLFGGLAATTATARTGGGYDGLTRLETAYVYDFPEALARLKVGDGFTRPGDWGTSFRFGGIQYATNFTVQPGFIPFALPAYAGVANLPSTVDVFIDNALRYRANVDQGPFSLNQIPAITGGGQTRVVVTDALGRQQSVTQPFYVSPQVLREGLSDFSFEAGFVRRNFQIDSFSYGQFIGAGTYRYGITDDLTVEAHTEGTQKRQAVGGSVTHSILNIGEVHGEGAWARTPNGGKWMAGFGYTRMVMPFSLSFSQKFFAEDFENFDDADFQPFGIKKSLTLANVGVALNRFGTFGVSLVRQSYYDQPTATIVSANWGLPLGQNMVANLYALNARQNDNSFTVGLSFTVLWGGKNTATAQYNGGSGGSSGVIQARHSEPDRGWDYGFLASRAGINQIGVDAIRRTQYGDFGAAVERFGDTTAGRLTASGSFVALPGSVEFARRIDDAYGVVSMPGFEGVTVLQDNRPVGKTDANGNLFLPKLISNFPAKITIDTASVPITTDIASLEQVITPGYRGGAQAVFEARPDHSRMVTIARSDGTPVTSGVQLTRLADGKTFRVGYDGEAYIEGSQDRKTTFQVADSRGPCRFDLPVDAAPGRVTVICGATP